MDEKRTDEGRRVMSHRRAALALTGVCVSILWGAGATARAADSVLTLEKDGELTFEVFSVGAPGFGMFLTQQSPGKAEQDVTLAQNGCTGLLVGVPVPEVFVHPNAVFGCRIRLDADSVKEGIQGFPAGTQI